jgi:hypothetical protein
VHVPFGDVTREPAAQFIIQLFPSGLVLYPDTHCIHVEPSAVRAQPDEQLHTQSLPAALGLNPGAHANVSWFLQRLTCPLTSHAARPVTFGFNPVVTGYIITPDLAPDVSLALNTNWLTHAPRPLGSQSDTPKNLSCSAGRSALGLVPVPVQFGSVMALSNTNTSAWPFEPEFVRKSKLL